MATPAIGVVSSRRVLAAAAFWVFACAFASGQTVPNVTGVSGSPQHGQTLTVTGTGFGAKSRSAPLVWEDFADLTLSDAIKASANGTLTARNTDNLRTPFSRYNARADYNQNGDFYMYGGSVSSLKWFVQYWIKLGPNWTWGTTGTAKPWAPNTDVVGNRGYAVNDTATQRYQFLCVKTGRTGSTEPVWNYTKGSYTNDGTTQWLCNGPLDDRRANIKIWRLTPYDLGYVSLNQQLNMPGPVIDYFHASTSELFTLNQWHLVQVEYGEESAPQAGDGHVRLWIDGKLIHSRDNLITTHSGNPVTARHPTILGWYDTYHAAPPGPNPIYAYYTDLFVEDGWSRIEIGDAPTYGACRHREVQIPFFWDERKVELTVNQGSFASASTAYLYVVNAAGAVNPVGVPVVFGGQATVPLAPSNVKVVR